MKERIKKFVKDHETLAYGVAVGAAVGGAIVYACVHTDADDMKPVNANVYFKDTGASVIVIRHKNDSISALFKASEK